MAIPSSQALTEQTKIVLMSAGVGIAPAATDWIQFKGASRVCFIIQTDNATTVTGSVVTVRQATANDGTGAKGVAFNDYYRNIDTATDQITKTAATNPGETTATFTTDTTDNKNGLYIVEIREDDMDLANSFWWIQLNEASGVNLTWSVVAIMYPAAYGKHSSKMAVI